MKIHHIKELAVQTAKYVRESDLRLIMTSLSYSTILSLIPLIALSLAVFKAIGGLEHLIPKVESFILSNLTIDASESAIRFLKKAISKIHAGKLGSYGFIFLLYTSLRLVRDIDYCVQKIWQIKSGHPFYRRLIKYWAMLLFFPLLISAYVGLASYGQSYNVVRGLPAALFQFCMLFSFLYLMFKLVPSVRVKKAAAFYPAFFVAIALIVSRMALVYALKSIIHYDKIYGSLASIPVLFVSISLGWYLVLFGVALSAGINRWKEDLEAPINFLEGQEGGSV